MVTKEELAKFDLKPFEEIGKDKASFRVTEDDLSDFMQDAKELPSDVNRVILNYSKNLNDKKQLSKATIAEYCHTNEKTLREYLNGTRRITRGFLYKLTIGLGLTEEEANPLFEKCGGKLNWDHCLEDHIVIDAMFNHDDIDDFIEVFNKFVPDSSKLK